VTQLNCIKNAANIAATNRSRRGHGGIRGRDAPETEMETPQLDLITDYMVRHGVALTQRNWIELAFFGQKHSIEELEGEEFAELPDGFEDWPADYTTVD
jgi:hypothetical protein